MKRYLLLAGVAYAIMAGCQKEVFLSPNNISEIDTTRADTIRIDTIRVDTIRVDTIRIDTIRIDTIRVDTVRLDTIQFPDDNISISPPPIGVVEKPFLVLVLAGYWWPGEFWMHKYRLDGTFREQFMYITFPDQRTEGYADLDAKGEKMVMARNDKIIVMNVKDQVTQEIYEHTGGSVSYPTFSPDGSKIAYTLSIGSRNDLFVIDATPGSKPIQLTDENIAYYIGVSSFSQDGNKITFSQNGRVYVYDLIQKNRIRLSTAESKTDIWPLFMPDGKNILLFHYVSSSNKRGFDMIICPIQEGSISKSKPELYFILQQDFWMSNPVLTKDGSDLYFIGGKNRSNLYKINLSRKLLTQLASQVNLDEEKEIVRMELIEE